MKTPKIEKLPSGNYFCRLRLGGQSIPITAPSKNECLKIAELTKSQYRAGAGTVKRLPKDVTLSEAVNTYVNRYKKTLSPSTVRGYNVYKRTRFLEYMDVPLGEIDFQEMIDDELKTGISPKTIRNAWGLIHAAIKDLGYPVPNVRLAPIPVPDVNFLQPSEIKPFCEAVKGRSYEIPALLMLQGLRMSEMRALTWNHINLKTDSITISGANVKGEDGYVLKKTNKNATSTRVIPIMIPQLRRALAAVKKKEGLVCTITPSVLLRDVKRACERAGVTVCSCHDLRRSFASLCYHLNISERQMMSWGGWASPDVMNKVYIKLAAADQAVAKNTVESFFIT